VAVLDWSAAKGRRAGRDSIWLGVAGPDGETAENLPTRTAAEARLAVLISGALAAGERLLLGCDFAFGYPRGFAAALTGRTEALAVWDWLAQRVQETPGDGSNYRAVAAAINAGFAGDGPFWGNVERTATPGLPRRRPALPEGLAVHRATELHARDGVSAPKSVWQLAGAGAVGAQALTGIPVLARLRARFAPDVVVWPFEPAERPVVLAEVYPSLLARAVRAEAAAGAVPDEAQVRLLARVLFRLSAAGALAPFLAGGDAEEGTILGAGRGAEMLAALAR
jgi:molybdopterin molybdotransferase